MDENLRDAAEKWLACSEPEGIMLMGRLALAQVCCSPWTGVGPMRKELPVCVGEMGGDEVMDVIEGE